MGCCGNTGNKKPESNAKPNFNKKPTQTKIKEEEESKSNNPLGSALTR